MGFVWLLAVAIFVGCFYLIVWGGSARKHFPNLDRRHVFRNFGIVAVIDPRSRIFGLKLPMRRAALIPFADIESWTVDGSAIHMRLRTMDRPIAIFSLAHAVSAARWSQLLKLEMEGRSPVADARDLVLAR